MKDKPLWKLLTLLLIVVGFFGDSNLIGLHMEKVDFEIPYKIQQI